MKNQVPQENRPQTGLQFFDCPRCKGFGYEMTAAKKHVRCRHCGDDPSMYVSLDKHILYWKPAITHSGIQQRRVRSFLHTILNGVLMLIGIAGVLSLVWAGYQEYQQGALLFDVLLYVEPNFFMAIFWSTLAVDLFLYYRLDQEKKSKKEIDYTVKESKQRRLAHPTFDKYDKHRHSHTDIAPYFSTEATRVVEQSFYLAKKLGHHQITPLHMMAALLETPTIAMMMGRLGVPSKALLKKIGKAMGMENISSGMGLDLGVEANRALFYAYEQAVLKKQPNVDLAELFMAVVRHDPWVGEILYDMEVEDQTVRSVVRWIHLQKELRRRYRKWKQKTKGKPKGVMDRAMTARESPLLQSMSQDYTRLAVQGAFFPQIGRDSEMDQVQRILRESVTNVLLVGPPGVGKSTIFEGLAEIMASEDVPKELQDKRLVVIDPGSLIANAQGTGAVEGRMQQLIGEIARAGNIVLGIEDVHHLLNMRSGSGSEDVAGILMNALSRGSIKVIATTTTEEYQQYVVNRGTFLRRFQMVRVDELKRDAAIEVLEARSSETEYKHKVFFTYDSLASIVDLSVQYIQDRYLPSKALDIMNEVGAFVQSRKGENSLVTKEDIAEVISEKTNVQVTSITQDERSKLLNLEELMHKRVVGQEVAVQAVASALRRAREGLRDSNRPIANLLFLGPTGVGKTETAKTIAEVYFGDEKNMIRIDMSEYQQVDSLRKLIGGKGEQGMLTEAIRLKPFSLILLDELEKAHPDVLNIFLQVMDDGRLTDGMGRTFDLTNTMIIATSNAGTQQIQSSFQAGLKPEQVKNMLLEKVLPELFRPEFINRFDNVVVFTPLTFDDVMLITTRMLQSLANRIQTEKGITFNVDPKAVEELAQKGYDPLYGARPLKRVIQDTVDDALAKLMLGGQVRRRDRIILRAGGRMEIQQAKRL
jgi:ATP-dependent Clp protease ATP-binding subunit ClpC